MNGKPKETGNSEPSHGASTCIFVLETRGLSIRRGMHTVLREVDLAVASGEIVALLGANGAGKTTLLHALVGALPPTDGFVLWFGAPAGADAKARKLVGFVGHDSGLYLALTSWENLVFAGRLYGVPKPGDRAAELLTELSLSRHAHTRVGSLSRGLRQRLSLARALLHEPKILVLDEPFTSLDRAGQDWLADILQTLRSRGRAIVFASHDKAQALRLADHVVALNGGRLIKVANARENERTLVAGSC